MKGGKKSAETEIEMDCGTTREQLSVSPCAPGAVADPVKGGLTPPPPPVPLPIGTEESLE